MSTIPHESAHSGSGTAVASIGQSGDFSTSTQSGRNSQNFAAVSRVFLDAWDKGDFDTSKGAQQYFDDLMAALSQSDVNIVSEAVNLDDLAGLTVRNLSQTFHSLAKLAAYASQRVYELRTTTAIDNALKRAPGHVRLLDAKPTGDAKNWGLFKDESIPAFCFAIRGTATSGLSDMLADNSTNLDANPIPLNDRVDELIHRGFQAAGEAIVKPFVDAINKAWTPVQASATQQKPILVLTGHSAGGGTAYFLYHSLLRHHSALLERFQHVYCLTFGSAAIASSPSSIQPRAGDRVISFVLENDPVPRLDLDYAQWVAKSMGIMLSNKEKPDTERIAFTGVPVQKLFPGGELILLQDGESDMRELPPDRLSLKAFLDIRNHKCSLYKATIDNLEV